MMSVLVFVGRFVYSAAWGLFPVALMLVPMWLSCDFLKYSEHGGLRVVGRGAGCFLLLVWLLAVVGGMLSRYQCAAMLESWLLRVLLGCVIVWGVSCVVGLLSPSTHSPARAQRESPDGPPWIVVGIDGSNSDCTFRFHGTAHTSTLPNAHVFNFVYRAQHTVVRKYFHGPATWGPNREGRDEEAIVEAVVKFVERARRDHGDARVALVGHSRGGWCAVKVAERLSPTNGQAPITFLGLYDAVDRHSARGWGGIWALRRFLGAESPTWIPPENQVKHVFHALRSRRELSQAYFGNTALARVGAPVPFETFACSHTAVGGDPWNQLSFDKVVMHLPNFWRSGAQIIASDREVSLRVGQAMRNHAAAAGLQVLEPVALPDPLPADLRHDRDITITDSGLRNE